MRQYRFAITGAQGAGKTTLCNDLLDVCVKASHRSCQALVGIGETVNQIGVPLGEKATVETIYAFAELHLRRERLATSSLVIQDRCMLDLLAYALVLRLGTDAFRSFLRETVVLSLANFDRIFLVPLASKTSHRGASRESTEFRRLIQHTIEGCANENGVLLERVEGTPLERCGFAFARVKTLAKSIFR